MEALEDMPLRSGAGSGINSLYNHTMMEQLLLTNTVADTFPPTLGRVVTGGKTSVLSFLAGCTVFCALGLPIWLLSMLVPEWSLYAATLLGIFFIGKGVMRMIVFPGSSHRVQLDIEAEFARYSVRMLESGAGAVIDIASTILSSSKANPTTVSNGSTKRFGMGGDTNSSIWKRACSYRDRVLVVYASVLSSLLRDRTANANTANFTSNPPTNLLGSDVGNLGRVTLSAQSDGRILLALLQKVLQLMKTLEDGLGQTNSLPDETIQETAKALLNSATELRDLLPSFKPQGGDDENGNDSSNGGDVHAGNEDLEETSLDAVRQQLGQQGGSVLDTVKSGIEFVVSMLDPPLHTSVFGMDALRGCVLSRYKGARQLWVQRPKGGMIDVMHIPAVLPDSELTTTPGSTRRTNRKAVLYCNPNAGLIEVATGLSLAGGNVVPSSEDTPPESWVDFYTENGYDIYLFNYAGFGRSFGRSLCGVDSRIADYSSYGTGLLSRTYRILRSSLTGFKPAPDSLRADAAAVGRHVIHDMRVESLTVHGESIGGLAATGATRQLTMDGTTRNKIALLICDRTFCNLPAVAQRLLGRWSGTAVQMLEPFWNTDVAADYLAVPCPKVVANDAADMIVNDVSSLKSGVAFSTEIRKQQTTKGSGCILDSPMEYQLSEWENVGVLESKYLKPSINISPPKWPRDRYVTLGEAFHFAACIRRIGKVATHSKNQISLGAEEEGVELSQTMFMNGMNEAEEARKNLPKRQDQDLLSAWRALSCCDGLCGAPLGRSLNDCNDGTISWLCTTLTFGGQIVVEAAEKRLASVEITSPDKKRIVVEPSDFDTRPNGYAKLESADKMVFPIPIPEVVSKLDEMLKGQSAATNLVQKELEFCIGMLDYIVTRLSSAQTSELYTTNSSLQLPCGAFKKLHCGHNNQFSAEERSRLQEILTKSSLLRGQSHV